VRRARDLPSWFRDTALRMLPHATCPGLYAIGHPGRQSPVLCTGNFTLTVRRMRDALSGRDAWLLVANSRGINVWCAAGGGHLTHHDVISAIRSSGVEREIDHRTIILPQLSATGVERRRISDATGWRPLWGPARLEDLPRFLDRGSKVHESERAMRFPLWERLEFGVTWALPTAFILGVALAFAVGLAVAAVAAAAVVAAVLGMFAALPWLRVTGRLRWLTHGSFALAAFAMGAGLLFAVGDASAGALLGLGAACAVSMGVLAIDLTGTTPWYPSTINSFRNRFHVELDEARCTGAAECVQVCPREVLRMDGPRRKVAIANPEQCIRCGACIVQCPEDALRFRFADGRVVEAETVRRTRLNMLGRRSIYLAGDPAEPARGRSARDSRPAQPPDGPGSPR
jgi:NAD-dependent dihydropyrimidine dehydrogenase PreA subunit